MDATSTTEGEQTSDGKKLTETSAIEQHFAAGSSIPLDGPPAGTQHQKQPDGDIHPSQPAWR